MPSPLLSLPSLPFTSFHLAMAVQAWSGKRRGADGLVRGWAAWVGRVVWAPSRSMKRRAAGHPETSVCPDVRRASTSVKIFLKIRYSTVMHCTMWVKIYLIRASSIVSKKSLGKLLSFPCD
jgi:hypothetical protein